MISQDRGVDRTVYRNGVRFVWNDAKAKANERKHGVLFEDAVEAFFDPFLRLVDATRGTEARDALIGFDTRQRLLVVVHLEIESTGFRLISARPATATERALYDS